MASVLQKLMQATGKSADEIMEVFGKKAAQSADDVSEAALLKNLQKEAADVSVPMGSGKNLEALQAAKEGMDANSAQKLADEVAAARTGMQQAQSGAAGMPFVDTERNINALPLEGMDFSGAPAAGKYKMPTPPNGQVASKAAAPGLAQSADELVGSIDDALKPGMSKGTKATLAGLTGLGALGIMGQDGGGGQQPPMAPQAKTAGPVPTEAPVSEQVKNVPKQVGPAQRTLGVELSEKLDQVMAGLPKEEAVAPEEKARPSYIDLMQQAQQAQSDNQFQNALLHAANQAGAAIAGLGAGQQVKADQTVADVLAQQAGKPVSDLQNIMKTEAQQTELSDEKSLRDPNSKISKTFREQLKPFLPFIDEKMSAHDLNKLLPQLTQLINTREAANARKEAAALQREAMQSNREEQNKFKSQSSVDKQIGQLYKSKDYEAYNTAKDAQSALQLALDTGDKVSAGSAFMQFAKIAQGDNSVVRDNDMKTLAGGYNYTSVGDMMSKLAARAKGGNFNATELELMKKVAQKIQGIKGARVQQLVSPIIKRADSAGLDLSESLDPATVREFTEGQSKSAEQQGLTTKTEAPAGQMVTVRRKSDGATKLMPAASAAKADPSKYEIIK